MRAEGCQDELHFARANLRALVEAAMRGFGRARGGGLQELELLDLFIPELRNELGRLVERQKLLDASQVVAQSYEGRVNV